MESITVKTYCNNYSLNLIINFYTTKAKEMQIDVEAQVELPLDLSISDMDLCLIFSNAIENAINALTLIPDTKDKMLKIQCKTRNDKIYIEIINSFEGNVVLVDNIPLSTLENHGYGTKSIAAITDKYNGVYSFTAENGFFKLCIIM